MYLADDQFRLLGVRDKSRVHYYSGTPGIFSVKAFAKTLNEVIARKEIETHYKHNLIAVRPDAHEAVFRNLETGRRSSSTTTCCTSRRRRDRPTSSRQARWPTRPAG